MTICKQREALYTSPYPNSQISSPYQNPHTPESPPQPSELGIWHLILGIGYWVLELDIWLLELILRSDIKELQNGYLELSHSNLEL